MRLQRDTWLAIGLLVILALLSALTVLWQDSQAEKPPYSSYAAQPNGALALREWMSALGYEILPDRLAAFAPPERARLLVMLEPIHVNPSEADALDAWVQRGNTLLLAGTGSATRLLASRHDVSLSFATPEIKTVHPTTPFFAQPPVLGAVSLETNFFLSDLPGNALPLLVDGRGRAVLVVFQVGEGRVILSSAPFLFGNLGLKAENAPEAVLNILQLAGEPGPVWFNEWHHGERGSVVETLGPEQWLRRTPIGRALLLIAGLIFLGLLLQGRAFGKPVPPVRELRRRAPLEYIRAIANLGRRAGHRAPVLRQYYQSLKRHLGKRYHLDPSLPDDEYVARLGRYNPNLDQTALLDLLTRLQKNHPGENEMVKLAAEAAEWLKDA